MTLLILSCFCVVFLSQQWEKEPTQNAFLLYFYMTITGLGCSFGVTAQVTELSCKVKPMFTIHLK